MFKIGDIVKCKIGGPLLIIIDMIGNNQYQCRYFNNDGYFSTVTFYDFELVKDK